jgi:hypothetical protein
MTDIICVTETHYNSVLNRAMHDLRSDFDKTTDKTGRFILIKEAEDNKYPLDFIHELEKDNV